ncbi:hypothetical protein QRZ34_28930 [Klebsiella michiganensis]|uniref:hypothetical protein n=1 Tax=Klebsiella michiganensis TaxID=1134687 RepID=UPI002570FA8C|nr:hypothetical protein [Klebsiella michiganensis]MDL4455012.1 hypothetical protein [Klebsiella michiganensis]
MTLGETLQLSGTPAFVVLPTKNAAADTLTVIAGAAEEEALRQAILKATPAPVVAGKH